MTARIPKSRAAIRISAPRASGSFNGKSGHGRDECLIVQSLGLASLLDLL
jgi:hypothetical protein